MSLIEPFTTILESTGEDIHQHDLRDTPKRAAKAFEFLTKGYAQSLVKITNDALFDSKNDEMVIVKNIELYSLCRHHLPNYYRKFFSLLACWLLSIFVWLSLPRTA